MIIDFYKEVTRIVDKISVIEVEKGIVHKRFSKLRSLITHKLSILEKDLEDLELAQKSYLGLAPTYMKNTKNSSYALSGLI